jgi:hypothetical protein
MHRVDSASRAAPVASRARRWAAGPRRLLVAATLVCAAIVAVWSCVVSVASASASEVGMACPLASGAGAGPESESAAQADAASLLAELPLPPGSSESASEPAEDDSLLAHPGEGPPVTPNAVDVHAWWLVPASPAETLVYVCTHLPAGTISTMIGGGISGPSTPENEVGAFAVPGNPGTLVIWAVRLPNGSTALRADAQVVWITPRPVSDTIPSGAHLLRIAVHDPNTNYSNIVESAFRSLLDRLPGKVTSVGQIDEIVTLLNELKAVQPGLRSCPFAGAEDSNVELSFYASIHAVPLALVDIHLGGCGGVGVSIGGVPQQMLQGGSELIDTIGKILGIKASVGPPVGALPRLSAVHMSRKRFGVIAEDIVTPGIEPGSEFLFTLSAPAEVSVAISRLPRGARYADTCLAAGASTPRRAENCLRTSVVDRFTRLTEPEGEDAITFRGLSGRRPLALGRYVALLRARNTGGGSPAAHVEFEITR